MSEIELPVAYAGDIVSVAGFHQSTVGHIVNLPGNKYVIPTIPIDPPMLSLTLTLNDSPLKGNDGDKLTITQIRERLKQES
jgi:GTP-binding protein